MAILSILNLVVGVLFSIDCFCLHENANKSSKVRNTFLIRINLITVYYLQYSNKTQIRIVSVDVSKLYCQCKIGLKALCLL